jgi:hypothetical protein
MILLVYPKFVGGKFISNCLALSRHCVVQHRQLAIMDINLGANGFNEKYYKFKLDAVMRTLPIKQDIAQWAKYEYGCDKLYGINESFYKEHSISEIKNKIQDNDIFNKLSDNHRESCLIAHDYRTLMKYLLVWPKSSIIEFTDYDKFKAVATKLKNGVIDAEYKQADEYYRQDQDFFKIDSKAILAMDQILTSKESFLSSIERVYKNIGFDDFNPTLISTFYLAYMDLHQ